VAEELTADPQPRAHSGCRDRALCAAPNKPSCPGGCLRGVRRTARSA
jgi:hypothetical protein